MTDFEKLFNDKKELVFKYLIKLTGNVSLAEELTQETFFRAYMNYASLKNLDKATVWLCQIAKNTYYAWFNEQKKKESIEVLDDVPDTENLEETFLQKELSCILISC